MEHRFSSSVRRFRRFARHGAIALFVLYAVLLIPDPAPPEPVLPKKTPFVWNQDARWKALEEAFQRARGFNPDSLAVLVDTDIARLGRLTDRIAGGSHPHTDPIWNEVEQGVFESATRVAACRARVAEYASLLTRLRALVKDQSNRWDLREEAVRDRLYRLLYGSRAALEEVILQAPREGIPALLPGTDEPSRAPAASFLGVTIRSGDILVSRGGAATSALIARGNDYPGNFSHIALASVDPGSGRIAIVESHIERGVTVSTPGEYLRDRKLRVMILRLRADLPPLAADPALPQKAASFAVADARSRHIPYDFAMDYRDHTRLFCSEVASAPYERFGVKLWMGLSSISSAGLARWLALFGVRNFETQEPSDLEYDPQLRIVAEWRDPRTLLQDHQDNAVTDVLLEAAERGRELSYDWYLLPVARAAKFYSMALNLAGAEGPVPEGMSATAGLRNKRYTRDHARIREELVRLAAGFSARNGYYPPYWSLVRLAREAKENLSL